MAKNTFTSRIIVRSTRNKITAMPLFKICGLEAREKQFVIAIKKSKDTRGEKCECHSGNK